MRKAHNYNKPHLRSGEPLSPQRGYSKYRQFLGELKPAYGLYKKFGKIGGLYRKFSNSIKWQIQRKLGTISGTLPSRGNAKFQLILI
jgi:hypothetical protein